MGTLYYENVAIGDSLPILKKGPVSLTDLVKYSGASGDFNPLHTVPEYARARAGLPDVIAHGMLNMAYAGQLITDWMGPGGEHDVDGHEIALGRLLLIGDHALAGHLITQEGHAAELGFEALQFAVGRWGADRVMLGSDYPQAMGELDSCVADVEALDLLIGTLAEALSRRPTKFGFGETLFQIFILNATRRLQADRFYTTCYNAETYTKEGLDWIDDATFRTVLLRHHPELAKTGLANIRNAFEPWDTVERFDSARHPLREFDRELGPDPWLGEMGRQE